jgi:hypothetical protein
MKAHEHFRIIRIIAGKDIIDAIRNRLILTILASVAFLMLSSQAIGLIAGLNEEPVVYVFDEGRSSVLKTAVRSREMRLDEVRTIEDLKSSVGSSPDIALGIVFPITFDAEVESGRPINVDVYVSNRIGEEEALFTAEEIRKDLSALTDADLNLQISSERAYPLENSSDYPMMLGFGLVMGVMAIGLILTPYLIIDEKSTHTLDAMLISPARHVHLVTGKFITGMIYALTASLLVLLISSSWIANWGIMAAAVFLGAAFASILGLLAGVFFDQASSVNMLGGLSIAVLMLPMYFWHRISTSLSATTANIISWLPSIRMYRLVRQALTYSPDNQAVIWNIVILTAACLLCFGLLLLKLRSIDQ